MSQDDNGRELSEENKKLIKESKERLVAKRKADQEALKLIHNFMKQYYILKEDDDNGHEENERLLIEGLYDIYDPQEI